MEKEISIGLEVQNIEEFRKLNSQITKKTTELEELIRQLNDFEIKISTTYRN